MTNQSDSKSRSKWRDERGFALVLTLVFAFLLTLVAMTFHGLGGVEADLVQRQITHSQALYLAEAGLERAMYELHNNPGWRGVDPPNGVAFADNDRSLGNGRYAVLIYDGTNDNQGLYDCNLDPACTAGATAGRVRLSSTGTAGPNVVRSTRRIEVTASFDNRFNRHIPGLIYVQGRLDEVKLETNFLIDGNNTNPLTGKREEADRCPPKYGMVSTDSVAEIIKELQDHKKTNQVLGKAPPPPAPAIPSVAQVDPDPESNITTLISDILKAKSPNRTFTGDKKVKNAETWGSYPGNMVVVEVRGELEVEGALSGAGILIVRNELEIEKGATFNWTGLVIMANENRKDSEVEFEHEGKGTIYGALLLQGKESELELKPEGAGFFYSCKALEAVISSSPSFSIFRNVITELWKELSP